MYGSVYIIILSVDVITYCVLSIMENVLQSRHQSICLYDLLNFYITIPYHYCNIYDDSSKLYVKMETLQTGLVVHV